VPEKTMADWKNDQKNFLQIGRVGRQSRKRPTPVVGWKPYGKRQIMNITKTFFRTIVLLGFAVGTVGDIIDLFRNLILPSDLQGYYIHHPSLRFHISPLALLLLELGVVAFNMTIIIGLLMFWKPARVLTLVSCSMDVVAASLINPIIEPGGVIALDYLSMLLTGVIIGLIYFSPANEFFQKRPPTATVPQ
jgi:hypothetical protein